MDADDELVCPQAGLKLQTLRRPFPTYHVPSACLVLKSYIPQVRTSLRNSHILCVLGLYRVILVHEVLLTCGNIDACECTAEKIGSSLKS